ncbi:MULTISPECIES: hypothetical protein [Pseudomonas]|jgi:hypothetical protein|uniref:Uncharacterized protein n=1 Tax=Pseudomonas fluorescens TaxID=294 RepID=A0A166QM80_PSEFL|nr:MULTISPECIES: hypothetical protein [Pseudomonas]KZN20510.1 hypothetical protein A1D17_02925 [Pseudomonas fluorescens]TCV51426.1 hypothetical protein EDB99_10792 [Pseudomonas sp. 460]
MNIQITARIERRNWYVNGQYLGDKSQFIPDAGETARELTGDFYGEWQGTRHYDGAAIVQENMDRAIEDRRLLLKNHPDSPLGDAFGYPIKLSDWGEYRIVTTASAASAI